MPIYVDVSSAVHGKAGLARYAESLANAMRPILGRRMRLFQNDLGRCGPLVGWENHPVAGVSHGYKPWRAMVWMRQLARLSMDKLLPEAELFHATEHLLPPLRAIPTVLTVHDLIFERYPRYHKIRNYLYLRSAMPLYCRRADAIIAISGSTRDDLVALYGIEPAKITVIPEAAAPHFVPQPPDVIERVRQRYGLPERYILAVGTLEPRKNLARLLQACGPLVRDGLVDGVVLVGSKGWLCDEFFRELAALPWRERVVLPGFVQDADLPAVYGGAMVTAQPSLYEGFGLPVLEAMGSGSPVASSDVSSLPEVGGDAARYFDPLSVESMTDVLRTLVDDEALRRELRAAGLERASQFSWGHTAEQTIALYERVIAAH